MLLRCTKDLAGWLDYNCKAPVSAYDDFYTWGADFLRAGGVMNYFLLLRNSATGFALLFDFLETKKFMAIVDEDEVIGFLQRGLTEQGFDAEDVAFYLNEGEHCTFTTQFESSYERKKLKDLSVWALETGIDEAMKSIGSLPVTIDRRKVDAKALFATLLKERRREIARELYPAVSVKVRLDLLDEFNVWRRFHLPLDLTYKNLHDIIQIAFGWDGMHLHEFRLGKELRIMPADDVEKDAGWDGAELLDENKVTLADVNLKKMTYIYDFGDYWVHEITLEKVLSVEERQKPICVGGEGSAPWEDCGGPLGYASIMESLEDPGGPDYEFAREWALSEDWDGSDDEDEDEDIEEELNDGTPFDQRYINICLKSRFS